MKNKKIFIAILIIALLFTAIISTVNATEQVETNAVENVTSAEVEEETTTDVKYEIGDLYAADEKLTIEEDVYGNAFIMGKDVTITDSKINGDVFVMGMNVTIDDTDITGSVFALGQNIEFTGESSITQVYACGQNILLGQNALISRDIRATGETVRILGTIGNNAFIDCNTLELNGKILGNLDYSAKEEAEIADGQVSGTVDFSLVEETVQQEKTIGDKLKEAFKDFVGIFITLLLIGIVFIFLDKKFLKTVYASSNGGAIGKSLLFALLGFAVIPLIGIILLFTGIGTKTGLALIYAFFLGILISVPAGVALVTGMTCRSKYSEENKANRKAAYGRYVLISLIFALLNIVPILGWMLKAFAAFLGFGAIMRNIFFKEASLDTNK